MRPGRGEITITRSASRTASSIAWVTRITVLPVRIQSRSRSAWSCSRVMAFSASSGSSIRTSGGSWTSARQKAVRCCMPPESS